MTNEQKRRKMVREGSLAGQELAGRMVLIRDCLGHIPHLHLVAHALSGFGCSPHTAGSAVYVEFPHVTSEKSTNPMKLRVEREDIERSLSRRSRE